MRWHKALWAAVVVPMLVVAPFEVAGGFGQHDALAQTAATAKKTTATAAASASATPAAAVGATAPASSAAAPATPAPAVAGPSPTPRPASSGAMDGATYAVRLKDLEQRIDELKEQIRRSHTRLSLLTDTILSGGLAGSRSDILFQNDMSAAFRLVRALFVLDGAVQYNKSDDSGALAEQKEIPIFSGSIPPGDHTVQILLQFQGSGYGVFSYLKGYQFEARSSHSFTAVEGKTISLQIVAYEKGGVTTPLEQRPAVRFNEKVTAGVAGPGGPKPAAAGAPPAPAPGAGGNLSTGFSVGAGSK
jgi:hypothetical protein